MDKILTAKKEIEMTNEEFARANGVTMEELRREASAWVQCEGYDEDGKEYDTLIQWLARKPPVQRHEPIDGGRGAGQYGKED